VASRALFAQSVEIGEQAKGGIHTSICLSARPQIMIEEFVHKLGRIIDVAHLSMNQINACLVMHNNIALICQFHDKFIRIWDSFGIKDK